MRYTTTDGPKKPLNAIQEGSLGDKMGIAEISPELGRVVPEIGNVQFRELIYSQYRIVYRIEKKRISILTVRHGRQELPIEEIEG